MNPRSVYEEKKSYYEKTLTSERRREDWCANGRLILFVATALTGWWFYKGEAQDLLPTLVPFACFVGLAAFHAAVLLKIDELTLGLSYFERGLARLNGEWSGKGNGSRNHEPSNHLFARDLDLFGTGSLFELLDTTFSRAGQSQLATWLIGVSSAEDIRQRQEATVELSAAVDDREALALHSGHRNVNVDGESLGDWAQTCNADHVADLRRITLGVSLVLGGLVALTLGGVLPNGAYLLWPVGAWSLYRYSKEYRIRADLSLAHVEPDLLSLRLLLQVTQNQNAKSSLLRGIEDELFSTDAGAERLLAKLGKLIGLKDAQRNQFFAPAAFLLLWDPIFVLLVEHWRLAHGSKLRAWGDASAKRDALMALALFRFENPDYCMPTILDPVKGRYPTFSANQLSHPFLPREGRVSNDVSLGDSPSVFMLSGSNMSGKSTLLRSVGINAVLALAGTSVCAEALSLSPVHLGATLRVHDSLADGRSRFYAEIERLAALLGLAQSHTPLLFLVDEIFHGTNSAARSTGARRLIEEFISHKAIGFVTTHDLSLADAVEKMSPAIQNIHLRDQVLDGDLYFDYELQPGILKEGNALHLMRAVGLPI